MAIITLRNLSLGHGGLPLFESANLTINAGEKICIIGRNGVGKSSLLKLILGKAEPDHGTIERQQSLSINALPQTIPDLTGNVFQIVKSALNTSRHEQWQTEHQILAVISKLDLDPTADFNALSGGLKRRVLLACALVNDTDVLLLDEPTNHLDISAIQWLEKFLRTFKKTLIMITHDRVLMQKIADHIIEIDNGQVISWRGRYHDFLKYKQTALAAEETANALFDKRLAEEEKWIRQGIKARRTRNEGRVRALKTMREQRGQRRIRPGPR